MVYLLTKEKASAERFILIMIRYGVDEFYLECGLFGIRWSFLPAVRLVGFLTVPFVFFYRLF